MDWLGYVLQGLFTGIGVGIANWYLEKHLKSKLDKLNEDIIRLNKINLLKTSDLGEIDEKRKEN